MDFQWGDRDPNTGAHVQITGIPSYYGVDSKGKQDFLDDGDIVNLIGNVNAGSSKLFRFEMSDSGYIGSRYRVHNDRNDIDYAKDVLLSGERPMIVDGTPSTQTQDIYNTSIDISTLDHV